MPGAYTAICTAMPKPAGMGPRQRRALGRQTLRVFGMAH